MALGAPTTSPAAPSDLLAALDASFDTLGPGRSLVRRLARGLSGFEECSDLPIAKSADLGDFQYLVLIAARLTVAPTAFATSALVSSGLELILGIFALSSAIHYLRVS